MGRRFDPPRRPSWISAASHFPGAGTHHRSHLDARQPPHPLLRRRTGLPRQDRYGIVRQRAAALRRGTDFLPPAPPALRLLQFVAEKFRQGPPLPRRSRHHGNARRASRRKRRRSLLVLRRLQSLRRHPRRPRLHLRAPVLVPGNASLPIGIGEHLPRRRYRPNWFALSVGSVPLWQTELTSGAPSRQRQIRFRVHRSALTLARAKPRITRRRNHRRIVRRKSSARKEDAQMPPRSFLFKRPPQLGICRHTA